MFLSYCRNNNHFYSTCKAGIFKFQKQLILIDRNLTQKTAFFLTKKLLIIDDNRMKQIILFPQKIFKTSAVS